MECGVHTKSTWLSSILYIILEYLTKLWNIRLSTYLLNFHEPDKPSIAAINRDQEKNEIKGSI